MKPRERLSTTERIRKVFVGNARDLKDENIFEKVTLVAIMAWVGLWVTLVFQRGRSRRIALKLLE